MTTLEHNAFLDGLNEAIDAGRVWTAMSHGKYWRVRRNGATQTWKRDPNRFRIPVKFGLKGYGQITESDDFGYNGWPAQYVISPYEPKGRPS